MVFQRIFWLFAATGLSLAAFDKNLPRIAPVPADPLEMVTGQIQTVDTSASREAVLQLLARARDSYALRSADQGYDLKVSFTVNSGGETEYDGSWKMEDVFDPQQGLRWTANAAAGYSTTQISANGIFYGEGTASTIPLRLQEARAALFDAIPAAGFVDRDLIRTSTSTFEGVQVTCILLSAPDSAATATPGRRWEETEECIDPQSGLLRVHSQVPGRYYAYEYSNALQLGGHLVPRKVVVTEAGKSVSEISVDSLVPLPAADPSLFVPSEEMKAAGPPIAMAGAQKIWRFAGRGPFTSRVTAHPVCVFGLVTPSGQLVEAHSLQPSDPNSPAAVEAAKRMNFFYPTPPGARPQQHFVFVIEKFVSSQ
ncbi:MAG: hypothetical protein ABSG13_14305 [Bryobacteraceae bacterium]|jgi:hypothetical protein